MNGTTAEVMEAWDAHIRDIRHIMQRKQEDYGPKNIGDGYNAFGLPSLLIRMNDKMQRLINLTKPGASAPNEESIDDSLRDLANYCIIALMCRSGDWPGTEGSE